MSHAVGNVMFRVALCKRVFVRVVIVIRLNPRSLSVCKFRTSFFNMRAPQITF